MRSKLMLLTILVLVVAGLTACGDAAPTAAPAAPAATSAPAAPASGAPASGGSATSPLPAQPTLPPVAPKQATPFAAATFSAIINVPAPTRAATPTAAAAAATTAPGAPAAAATTAPAAPAAAVPTAPGVATGKYEELKVDFVQTLGTAEQVDEIAPLLKAAFPANAIKGVSGNEVGIAISYDPGLVTPGQIRVKLASLGHAVKN